MSNLLENLQALGDAEHDDLSVAHDALAEIVKLRLEKADLLEALQYAIKQVPELATVPGISDAIIRARGEK
jgi:Zn-dependent oligopeptidase